MTMFIQLDATQTMSEGDRRPHRKKQQQQNKNKAKQKPLRSLSNR